MTVCENHIFREDSPHPCVPCRPQGKDKYLCRARCASQANLPQQDPRGQNYHRQLDKSNPRGNGYRENISMALHQQLWNRRIYCAQAVGIHRHSESTENVWKRRQVHVSAHVSCGTPAHLSLPYPGRASTGNNSGFRRLDGHIGHAHMHLRTQTCHRNTSEYL
jgi:hypothetical protein